ncbi:MAG: 30S ribosomal protein S17 [Rhodocyclaceae bacterium]|nr:30S ribosomal protein S17 [Rhodocyclaceae bacterium]MBK9623744.1 30S ribosomal protein S17 [Rhodocyclaceae bacterium]MBL0075344.1 30S ribosomal protein S17 [Rhodocyclaceae bacterium]MBP6108472.1 30S ribosomal protein S17 [Rhodocyclaceae bacterium]MBP6278293.1 30S ribosomal protein S17 [Rhodocyclaceae bacterium]
MTQIIKDAPTKKRTLTGRVVSDKMQKTVTVLVERKVKHAVIGKIMSRSKKYHADVASVATCSGDLVVIEECAPISKTKAWRVIEVLNRS